MRPRSVYIGCLFPFSFMPFAMQVTSKLPERAGCLRLLLLTIFLAVLLQRLELKVGMESAVAIYNNKPVVSLVWGWTSRFIPYLAAVMEAGVIRGGRRRLELADRVRAHLWWSLRSFGAGACFRGRRPAISGVPPHLLAEGRPPLFLPAIEPAGRQFCSWLMATAQLRGSLVAPSGVVPGDGEVVLDQRQWTRSLFSFQSRVLLEKSRDLVVLFYPFRVLVVKCSVYLLDE